MLCGEKLLSLNGSAQSIGSPSRMRGKEGDELGLGQTIRITPAYAGKARQQVLVQFQAGITPAYAGKRGSGSLPRSCRRDHPRVCGEKISQTRRNLPLGGSPPRVRGKVRQHLESRQSVGITPAYAGKRPGWADSGCQRGDHPRVYGEKVISISTMNCG